MSYHLTSTMIDDEELIEELKKYDEQVVIGAGTSSKGKKGAAAAGANGSLLTEKNREIYLKKLNHYKAREKAESNPSKQYLKQKQQAATGGKGTPSKASSSSTRGGRQQQQQEETNATAAAADDDDDDVIDITDSKNTGAADGSGYYVQMASAGTSPLSNTTYYNYDHNQTDEQDDVIYTTSLRSPAPPPTQPLRELNYMSLKDKMEVEKTLSKYRSDINNILNSSKTQASPSSSGSSSRRHNDENSEPDRDRDTAVASVDYACPKPARTPSQLNRSIFDVFKPSTYLKKVRDDEGQDATSAYTRQLRGVRGSANWRGLSGAQPNKEAADYLVPVKDTSSPLAAFYHDQFKPFVTNFGLQFSKLLPYLVIMIFTIIILQYVRMKLTKPGDAATAATDSLYSGSDSGSWFAPKSEPSVPSNYCPDIKDIKCSQTKVVLRDLIDYLRSRSGVVDCTVRTSTTSTTASDGRLSVNFIEKCIHLNEIVDYLANKRALIAKKHQPEAVDSLLKAILRNPHWDVRLISEAYAETSDPAQAVYLMSSVSSKPVMCRLREGLQVLYIRGLMIASAVVVIVLAYFAVSLYNRERAKKNQIFYDLVGQVVAMVEKQYEMCLRDPSGLVKPYVVISHIYDTLVEPSQRAHQKALWNKVIKFIADHESRIHLETQFIDGEETHVWKWIVPKHHHHHQHQQHQDVTMTTHSFGARKQVPGGGIGLANSTMINGENAVFHSPTSMMMMTDENMTTTGYHHPGGLTTTPSIYPALPVNNTTTATNNSTTGWQGDAFSKSDRTVSSPTPCLKIRNMFDQTQIERDPHFAQKIHNAILEKCSMSMAPNTTILHIACDKKSKEGCVYVKCVSNEAAGRAYQALNGTWYNGKLLNVKYLRSDRYLERFPESIAFNTPLQRL